MPWTREPGGLAETLRTGSHREQLVAMRDFLADQIVAAPFREVAPIAAQLRQILVDLESMPLANGESVVDQLAQARAQRQADAALAARPAVSDVGRA